MKPRRSSRLSESKPKASGKPNRKSRLLQLNEVSDGYEADKESSDAYDFEKSEDYKHVEKTVKRVKCHRKSTSSTVKTIANSQKKNKRQSVSGQNPLGATKTGLKKEQSLLKASKLKENVSFQIPTKVHSSTKSVARVKADSGIFMTPSPNSSAVFHLSLNNSSNTSHLNTIMKKTSTPAVSANVNKKPTGRAAYREPLSSPPNVSPVKSVITPSAGLHRGDFVKSPLETETADNEPPKLKYASPRLKPDSVAEERITIKTLDISKNYANCVNSAKKRKTSKTSKRVSITKYDVWADEKATEFAELDDYELSIELE